MTNLLYWLTQIIVLGFYLTLPLLIVAYFVKRSHRPFIKQWLLSSNSIVYVYCLGTFINWVIGFIGDWRLADEMQSSFNANGYSFWYSQINNPGIYLYLVLQMLILFLFAFRRIRASFVWGMIVLILFNFEKVYVLLASLLREYLPSSWSVYYRTSWYLYPLAFVVFNLMTAGVFYLGLILNKKRKSIAL